MPISDVRPNRASLRVAATMTRGCCPTQQDAIGINSHVFQSSNLRAQWIAEGSDDVLLCVADGVAVSPGAAMASKTAVSALGAALRAFPDRSFDGLLSGWHVRHAHQHMLDAMRRGVLPCGASTTLVAAHIRGDRVAVVNSGDSRAYRVDRYGQLWQLSRDHTERQRVDDDASGVNTNSSLYDALSDCLIAEPDVEAFAIYRQVVHLDDDDRVLLCSDGLHDVINADAIVDAIAGATSEIHALHRLRVSVQDQGAPDNLSIIITSPIQTNRKRHEQ